MKALILISAIAIFSGCSTMKIVKDCSPSGKENIWVCKTIKFWE